jgi:hypothetical protein
MAKHLFYLYLVSVLDFHNKSQGGQTEDDGVDNVQQVEALQLPTKVVKILCKKITVLSRYL